MTTAAKIDWVEHWRELVSRREAQSLAVRGADAETENFWDRRASSFAEMTRQRSGQPDRFLELVSEHVNRRTMVMDVGAGVGRYAIPLGRIAREVIAIEPSEKMCEYLEQNINEANQRNVWVIKSSWERVTQMNPVDVVICSHVIYTIEDVLPFIKKLQDHTEKCCFIAIRVEQVDGHLNELWKLAHGTERESEPNLIDLYNLLHQIGIQANVEITAFGSTSGSRWNYATWEDAMEHCRSRLYTKAGGPEDRIIHDYLGKALVEQDGRYVWPAKPIKAGIVWWQQEERPPLLIPRPT